MAQKWPKMAPIWQYSTLFNFKKGIRFLYKTNRLACLDPIRVPNSKTYTEYFQIILFNQIIRPSLVYKFMLFNFCSKGLILFELFNVIFMITLVIIKEKHDTEIEYSETTSLSWGTSTARFQIPDNIGVPYLIHVHQCLLRHW